MKKFRIFAHRGLWYDERDENSLEAMSNALKNGFDLELDLRYINDKFVIKHDKPLQNEMLPSLNDVISIIKNYPGQEIAMHFKYDDWEYDNSLSIVELLQPVKKHVFLFDMSLDYCEKIKKIDEEIKVGVSVGDKHYHNAFVDIDVALKANIDIIWADENRNFYDAQLFNKCQKEEKIVYCISPDLALGVGHPNAEKGLNKSLLNIMRWGGNGVCTDKCMEVRKIYADYCTSSW